LRFVILQNLCYTVKVSENFKENMKIIFDEYLGKWNYRAIPEVKT
jgi:hypothetical protein